MKPKQPAPLTDDRLRQMISAKVKELFDDDDHPVSIDVKEFLATNPSTNDLKGLLLGLEKTELVQNMAVDVTSTVRPKSKFNKAGFSSRPPPARAARRAPVTSVKRNGAIYASRNDVTEPSRAVLSYYERLADEGRLPDRRVRERSPEPLQVPVVTQPEPYFRALQPQATALERDGYDTVTDGEVQPEPTPGAVTFANPGGTGTEAERAMQAQLEKINATVKGLGAAEAMLKGASPLDKVNLMRQLQEDANLQALVAAGLMKWSDVLMPNPERGKSGHVDGVDVGKPVIDQPKLTDLRSKLAALGRQGANTELQRVAQRQRRRVTSGYKPSQRGDAFPGKRIWTGPRYMPGTVTNPNNVSS
eukprot:SAG22_NODE_2207_length_2838_cov_1.538153_2_plen_361_part_00